MNIVNIALCAYNEDWGYQENLLPAYQRKLGHNVWLITINEIIGKNGQNELIDTCHYVNEAGVNVIRIKKQDSGIRKVFDNYKIQSVLKDITPDLIFFHGMHYFTIWQAVRYIKKNTRCKLVVDNHEDQFNHAFSALSIKGKFAYRMYQMNARLYQKFVSKAYGVTEGRCDYIRKVYGFPNSKIDLLLMGVDDEKVHYENRSKDRRLLISKLGLKQQDFLIVTGGKLDPQKKILELIEAFQYISKENTSIKLLIFGSIAKEIADDLEEKMQSDNIFYLGFLNNQEIYNLFLSADLGIFPGGHSVLWEQAVGCGLPCVFMRRTGMTHVDVGGNCVFLTRATMEEISDVLQSLFSDKKKYNDIKKNAALRGVNAFSYMKIAAKSLEVLGEEVK